MPINPKSRAVVTPAFGLIEARRAAARRIDNSLQCVAPKRSDPLGTRATASAHKEARHNRDGDDCERREFWGGHNRLLILVIGRRSGGTIASRIAAVCDLAHTYARKFLELLLDDERCGQAFGYWLP